jgi:hypothetical protein
MLEFWHASICSSIWDAQMCSSYVWFCFK